MANTEVSEQEDAGKLFLKLFVKELISKSSPSKNSVSIENDPKNISKRFMPHTYPAVKSGVPTFVQVPKITKEIDSPEQIPWAPPQLNHQNNSQFTPRIRLKEMPVNIKVLEAKMNNEAEKAMHPSIIHSVEEKVQPAPPTGEGAAIKQIPHTETLTRINNILLDPAVISIECTGSGKPLLINRSGITQVAGFTLSAEEITRLLEDISRKTRIPLMKGLFKAALENIIITAIVSEIIGSRFIIQKKNFLSF